MMPCTRIYIDPTLALMSQARNKELSKPYKSVMREHEGAQFILYHYNIKGQHASFQKGRKQAFKEAGKLYLKGISQKSMLS